jgi:6-pyruvoyltetrahydropterin/6-carboxytetrahydropterin synthase
VNEAITREFGFDMGHCLPDHLGGCYRPHGHRYRLEVTLAGDVIRQPGNPENGMIRDFGNVKRIVGQSVIDQFDHRFVMARSDPRAAAMSAAFDMPGAEWPSVLLVDKPPTAETLAEMIAGMLIDELPSLKEVRLWETPTCSATWTA